MTRTQTTRNLRALWGLLCALLFVPSARGQERDEYGDVNQTVARIALISGDVSFSRGDDPDNWQPADRNVPMTLGDRVYTGSRSRLELQVHGGDVIRLGAQTDLAALNLTDDTKQFSVKIGVASFRVRHLSDYETFEVDTPNASVSFEAPGDYRVDVDSNGNTRVRIRRGSATVAAAGGQVGVQAGEEMDVYGLDAPRYDIARIPAPDGWDQWVDERESRFARARSYRYVSADIVGADDLDDYGRWQQVPQYGWVWSPSSVDPDWVPYRAGHWMWQDPWGWSWVSAEPWGWAPYHYGRWVVVSRRWCWVPVAPAVRAIAYSPALVAFVGGGPGWSLSISSGGGGFIGWFPLGPRDPFVPWWGSRAGMRPTTITNVTYVNRTYVTVVNHNTFVSGGVVTTSWVRDRGVLGQVASAPVLRGPIPVMPTASSLRVAGRTGVAAGSRPPAAIVERSVVVRAAPPPAPPTFQSKLRVIGENQGAPVAPAEAARISVENRGRPQTVTAVRPATAESGRAILAPRSVEAGAPTRRPEPVTAFRGRPMATAQQPVATSPTGSSAPPGRQVAPRQSVPPAEGVPAQPAPEVRRERQPIATPAQGSSVVPPGERGRPQSEEWRQRVQPTQAPAAPGLERRRVGAPSSTPGAPPPSIEQRRERPTPAPQVIREGGQERRREAVPPAQQAPAPPAAVERQRERPTPAPQGMREAAPGRREMNPAPQQAAPPPAAGVERRERPTSPPQPARQAQPERGRQGSPPAQQQPSPQPAPQGENRPQVQRGRPEEQKKDQKKEEKKEERGRKPTPSS